MKRYDLRHLKDDFYDRMVELIDQGLKVGEVGIFLFEVGDFSSIQKSADVIKQTGHELMNSLKFNEVDWTVVVKKASDEDAKSRKEALEASKQEAEESGVNTSPDIGILKKHIVWFVLFGECFTSDMLLSGWFVLHSTPYFGILHL